MSSIFMRTVSALSAAVLMISAGAVCAGALTADDVVFPTYNNEKPASDCVTAGVAGSYNTDIKAALKRINEIRLEACKEGIPNPDAPSKKLTESDYVPIKWSASLEKVARVRAAEATLRISHTRPNDLGPFSISSSDVFNCAEVLAWNGSNTIVSGIEQFYREKADWKAQNSDAVTGHYESMIAPSNIYVGMSSFTSSSGTYGNAVAGRFGNDAYGNEIDETYGSTASGIASVIVKKSYLSGITLKRVGGTESLGIGKAARYELRAKSSIDGAETDLVFGSVTWKSSNTSVASVDSYGRVVGKKAGTATITATCGSVKATKTISVIDSNIANAAVSTENKTYTYTGKAIKPSPKVTVGGKTLTKGTDFTISYKNSAGTGLARMTIKGKGSFTGTKYSYYYIKPAQWKVKSIASPAKGRFKVKWTRDAKQVTGYQIFYATNKNFTGKKSVKLAADKSAKTITGLKSNRVYFVKLRGYIKTTDPSGKAKTLYGKCSAVRTIKVK